MAPRKPFEAKAWKPGARVEYAPGQFGQVWSLAEAANGHPGVWVAPEQPGGPYAVHVVRGRKGGGHIRPNFWTSTRIAEGEPVVIREVWPASSPATIQPEEAAA